MIIEYQVSGNLEEAVKYMREYLAERPDDEYMHLRLGYILSRYKKEYEEAISEFNKVIALDPDNLSGKLGPTYNYLGHAYLYLGRFKEAIAALKQYQSLLPGNADPLHSMADALRFMGRYKEAIDQYREVIAKHPSYLFTYEGLGLAYLAVGRWKHALACFKRYCNEAPPPKKTHGYILMGRVYLMQGEYNLAREKCDQAQEISPQRLYPYWLRGCAALAENGDVESAKRELQAMDQLVLDPGSFKGIANYYHLYGLVLVAKGRVSEGLEALREAIEECPRYESIFFRKELAAAYVEAGMVEEAVQEASNLLSLNENDAEVRFILGRAYEEGGDSSKAASCFRRALKIWKEADADFRPLQDLKLKLGKSI